MSKSQTYDLLIRRGESFAPAQGWTGRGPSRSAMGVCSLGR